MIDLMILMMMMSEVAVMKQMEVWVLMMVGGHRLSPYGTSPSGSRQRYLLGEEA
jgi:hypothetical protein